MNFTSVGGRRFTFAVCLTLLAAMLLWFGKLTSGDFTTIVNCNVIALIAGHTAERFAKGKGDADTTS